MLRATYKLEITRWSSVCDNEWEPLDPEVIMSRRFLSLDRARKAALRKAKRVVTLAWDGPGDEFHFFVLDSVTKQWTELDFPDVYVTQWSTGWPHGKKVTIRERTSS